VPKPARSRTLHAQAERLTTHLERDLRQVRRLEPELSAPYCNVTVRDVEWPLHPTRAGPDVSFEIGRLRDGGLFISRWSITGSHEPRSSASRIPLHIYSRAALLTAEHYFRERRRYTSRYEVDEHGRIDDPHPLPRPKRPRARHQHPCDETRIKRAVNVYRQALERGDRAPTVAVARALHVGRSTAARDLAAARKRGWLGPAYANRAGERGRALGASAAR
jgi:hypothetical protein